jgi:ribosomal protein S18 acetylase RimI-like enzyme
MGMRRVSAPIELEEAKRVRATAFPDLLDRTSDMDDLAHGDTFELWGAFEGAKTAGVIIERFPSLAFEGKPIEAGEVYVVGVLPEFRCRGVATALVEHALCDF